MKEYWFGDDGLFWTLLKYAAGAFALYMGWNFLSSFLSPSEMFGLVMFGVLAIVVASSIRGN